MPRFRRALGTLLLAAIGAAVNPLGLLAQPWAPGQGPPPGLTLPTAAEAKQLEQLRLNGEPQGLRERYLREAWIPRLAPVSPQLILCYIAEKVLGLPRSY